ncbi:MAG TPA: hypothetical protein VEC57_07250 [Candidatus Limnocylindrales bacterium]|nr:hypothetical protein [Candidatus Limnocylindrales bacterium]
MRALLLLLCLLMGPPLAGCTADDSTARGTAEAFLDDHYVRIQLTDALAHTTDLARQKVEKEIELARDSAIDGETAKPHVSYTQKLAREDAQRATFEYELLIRPEGMEPFRRLVLVVLKPAGDVWRVTNFSEKTD